MLPSCFLACAIVLGGASAGGIWARCVLILISILVLAMHQSVPARAWGGLLALAIPGWFLVELIPLPPALWTLLPGRGPIEAGFRLSGTALPWLGLSLTPQATLAGLLALLPPGAMLVAIMAARPRRRLQAMMVLVGLALLSLLLGFVQAMAGDNSGLYLYDITNRGSAVGLFANRNHLATLLLMALPALGALAAVTGRFVLPGLAGVVLACGVVLVHADAGVLMLGPVLLVSLALARGAPWRRWIGGSVIVLMLAGLGATLSSRPMAIDQSAQHRPAIWSTTWAAVRAFAPLGAGGGSFTQVYPAFEDPSAVSGEYVNHAHGDALEILLEHGVAGALLAAGVVVWWAARLRALIGRRDADPLALAGAAMLAIALVHSLVDYPLRTSAIAVVAALAAGLLATPLRRGDQE